MKYHETAIDFNVVVVWVSVTKIETHKPQNAVLGDEPR